MSPAPAEDERVAGAGHGGAGAAGGPGGSGDSSGRDGPGGAEKTEAAGRGEVIRAAAITVSSKLAAGPSGDRSGEAMTALLAELGASLIGREIVPDSRDLIAERLRHWADGAACELILTSGGTGFSPDDLTPEATEDVIDRRAPGLAEAMRAASIPHTRHWMLSRATAGIRGSALIINLPGSPRSIGQCGEALLPALPHALALLRGKPTQH